jgi:hypothetical protein
MSPGDRKRRIIRIMVDVTLLDDRAVFELEGFHKLWALKSRLEIPLAHITAVEFDPDLVGRWWHGWKLMGAEVPGLFAAGTFYYHGELVFWDVNDPVRTIIISLEDERYKKLILEVADPAGVVARLERALKNARR